MNAHILHLTAWRERKEEKKARETNVKVTHSPQVCGFDYSCAELKKEGVGGGEQQMRNTHVQSEREKTASQCRNLL